MVAFHIFFLTISQTSHKNDNFTFTPVQISLISRIGNNLNMDVKRKLAWERVKTSIPYIMLQDRHISI